TLLMAKDGAACQANRWDVTGTSCSTTRRRSHGNRLLPLCRSVLLTYLHATECCQQSRPPCRGVRCENGRRRRSANRHTSSLTLERAGDAEVRVLRCSA